MLNDGSFQRFIHPDCDRRQFILKMLADFTVPAVPLSLEGAHHILVRFPAAAYNPQYKMKTVLAHYDRVDTSPGANDNSAAVFQIIHWARRLLRFPGAHNVQIIFSDGEEMGGSEGVSEQGAFGIATKFRSLGLTQQDVYAFDCCGRGDFVVLSQAGKGKGSPAFQRQFNSLVEVCVCPGDFMRRIKHKQATPGTAVRLFGCARITQQIISRQGSGIVLGFVV